MNALTRYAACASRADAKACFLDELAAQGNRIERTRRKMRDIYAFRTPDSPYVECQVTDGPRLAPSAWAVAEEERALDDVMRSALCALYAHPQLDVVPTAGLGPGNSDMIPSLWGLTFDVTREGAVMNRDYLFSDTYDLAARVGNMPEADVAASPRVQGYARRAAWLAEEFSGAVEAVYPQMQGPLTNAARTLPQDEMLVACAMEPQAVKLLVERQTRAALDMIALIRKAAGGAMRVRPRARFHQPEGVEGLFVDDYISVIGPRQYDDICRGSWQSMADAFGGIFFHTCGPVAQSMDMMAGLPGLRGFEFAFARGQHKTTADVEELLAFCRGKLVVHSFMLPFGQPVGDMEHFDRTWAERMSQGGGFALQFSGTTQDVNGYFS